MAHFSWKKRLLILPPIVIGAALVIGLPLLKTPPAQVTVQERAQAVRFIKAQPLTVVPRAIGYGTTRPVQSWDAVAEVKGRVVWASPKLLNGSMVKAGEELLRIEPSTYQLALRQVESQLIAAKAKDKTLAATLKAEQQKYALSKKDYDRKETLAKKGSVSKSSLETARRDLLASQTAVATQQSNMDLNKAEVAVLEAQKESAQRDLDNTIITAPFDLRLTSVSTGLAQYANIGQALLKADNIAATEVEAQFPIGSLRPLLGKNGGTIDNPAIHDVQALLRLNVGKKAIEWEAKVDRVAGLIDTQTQTIGIIARLDDPYGQAIPGKRPPLSQGTFVEVILKGKPMEGKLVIPRSALRQGKVFVVDGDNRLAARKVQPAYVQSNFAVIREGLSEGDQVIVSKISAPIEGMLLDPKADKKSALKLAADAAFQNPSQNKGEDQ